MTTTAQPSAKRTAILTLGALGVVFGDIGTSPLYAMRASALAAGGGATPTPFAVMGALSLIIWSLIVVVTLKYVLLIMRADNEGEGGVLALAALAHRSTGLGRWTKTAIGIAAILGLALFYGDGMLTPAISVLSAVEGLKEGGPALEPLILPLSLIILVGLFVLQSRGTDRDRQDFRACDGALVHRDRRARLGRNSEGTGDPQSGQSHVRHRLVRP